MCASFLLLMPWEDYLVIVTFPGFIHLYCCLILFLYSFMLVQFMQLLSPRLGGSVGCAVRLETRRSRVQPPPRSATFFRGDYEIFSTVILSLPLIQEGQLSVSGERMCTILVNRLED